MVERRLGAPPASAEFLRELDVTGNIDVLCPVREVAHVAHGWVITVLVPNRLSAPAPLVRVADWAREWAVGGSLRDRGGPGKARSPWPRSSCTTTDAPSSSSP